MIKPIAIILVNWNTFTHTSNCINALKKHCNQNIFDIIVCDNGSTDQSFHLLKKEYTDIIYLDNKKNLGFAAGNNVGLNYSIDYGYQYSLVLNTDTITTEDFVTILYQYLIINPNVAGVQPAIYWMHQPQKLWNGEGKYNTVLGKPYSELKINNTKTKEAKWLTGCCILFRNSVLQETGLFNSIFFLYFEDVELSYRIRSFGYRLHFLPFAKILHEAGASAKKNNKQTEGNLQPVIHFYICRNHFWFLRLYGNQLFYPVNLIYNTVYYLGVYCYFKLRKRNEKAQLLLKGFIQGVANPKKSFVYQHKKSTKHEVKTT